MSLRWSWLLFCACTLAITNCSPPPQPADGSADGDSTADARRPAGDVFQETSREDARTRDANEDVAFGVDASDVLAMDSQADAETIDTLDASDEASIDGSVEGASDAASDTINLVDAVDAVDAVDVDAPQDSAVDTGVDVPAPTFVIGGTLRGLTAGTITLRNNGGDDLVIGEDRTFRFVTPLPTGSMYSVTIVALPMNHQCAVTSGGVGTVAGMPVTDVVVDCAVSSSRTFSFTGMAQDFVVPLGVTSVSLELWGAEGSPNQNEDALGGAGGFAGGVLAVAPGSTLHVSVGGQNGFNGGGAGGINLDPLYNGCVGRGGTGGGGSDIRVGGRSATHRVIVAGGGGGAGGGRGQRCRVPLGGINDGLVGGGGGGGGGLWGGGGGGASIGAAMESVATGGTQAAGGGAGGNFSPGSPGRLGVGGFGGNALETNIRSSSVGPGGGNGGGESGDSGRQFPNSATGQSGAGGSSYVGGPVPVGAATMGLTMGVTRSGERRGDGQVIIRW